LMLLVILYKVDVNKCNPVYSDEDYSDEDYSDEYDDDDYDYQELSQQSDDTNDEDLTDQYTTVAGNHCRPGCYKENQHGNCIKKTYKRNVRLVARCLNNKKTGVWKSYEQHQFCTTKLIC